MAECLQGVRIALVAADGVGQTELEASGEAVRDAGAQTQLLSLRAGHIESLDEDLEPVRTYTVDQTVAQATVEEYDALLLVPGTAKSDRLSSEDVVVSFVRDFITSQKPVGIVCYGAWTLLEAGVGRGPRLPLSMTTRRKTGASLLTDKLISPFERRAFYSTIVEEFARLLRPPARAPLPWLDFEKYSAAT
ncbi:MAG: DJ-1/PfpI family protein [Mycobacterium sp.]